MKQNNKSLGRFKLALLVLCTIFVFITAAMSVGFLGAKNSKAANAYTADNKSNFVQVYDGKDIFDASSGSFRIDGMEALFKAISGSSTYSGMSNWMSDIIVNSSTGDYVSANAIRVENGGKDLLVKVGGEVWTITCMSDASNGDIYAVLWLAESNDLSNWEGLHKTVSGTDVTEADKDYNQSPRWATFLGKLDKYILTYRNVPDCHRKYGGNTPDFAFRNGNKRRIDDKLYIPQSSKLIVYGMHEQEARNTGFWDVSTAQRSNSIDTWFSEFDYIPARNPKNVPITKYFIHPSIHHTH